MAHLKAYSAHLDKTLRKPWLATVPTLELSQNRIAREWQRRLNLANAGHTNDWSAEFILADYQPSQFDYRPDNVVTW